MTARRDLIATLEAACVELLGTSLRLDASFFDLGGDSTQVVALAARLRAVLDVDVDVRDVYQSHTLAELAARLDDRLRRAQQSSERQGVPRRSRLAVTWSQEHVLSVQRAAARAGRQPRAYLVGPMVYRVGGDLDLVRFGDSLNAVVDRHDALRARFGWDQDRPFQQIASRGQPTLQSVAAATIDTAVSVVRARTSAAFGLEEVPRVRAAACWLGSASCYVVALAFDHLVADRAAAQLILSELSACYTDATEHRPPPPPSLAYGDYVDWQREHLTGEVLDQHVRYWRDKLGPHVVPVVDLPFASVPGDRWIARASPVRGTLTQNVVGDLLDASRRRGCTPFCLLLTALAALLARCCGAPQAVTFPIANRDLPETEHLVASLFNRIVFYPRWLSTEMTWHEAIGATWRDMNEARTHHDLPYPLLTRLLAGDQFGRERRRLAVSLNVVDDLAPPAFGDTEVTDIGGGQEELNPASLDVYVIRRRGDWTIELWADHEVVEAARLSAMLDDLLTVLTAMIADPQGRIAAVPLALGA
jgi:aryl carrier-like protein